MLVALLAASVPASGEPARPGDGPRERVDRSIARRLVIVRGDGPRVGRKNARVRRYLVEVERRLSVRREAFADRVEEILSDRRGWIGGRGVALRRVSSGPVSFRVTLARPRTTDRLCAPLQTAGIYSCYMNGRSVLNAMRWRRGATAYHRDLEGYRTYLVNHEVGHALGHGHAFCRATRRKAPVMMQQTKGVRPCEPNPWPLERERR
ncbi:MAG: DUF3152 domain-containing protein [Actinomycetota bacterium]